jgi:hypothetical protein
MHHLMLTAEAATHQTYAALLRLAGRGPAVRTDAEDARVAERDRGAVSLEQVLWFVAAGVSVAVIAAILWGIIRDQAEDPANINPPVAP